MIAARKNIAVLAFAAALAGCATGDPLTNDLLTQSIATGGPRKSVCAISGIGDTFALQKIGLTVFGNALDKAPIEAWGIDQFVTNKIGAQLSQRFDVKKLAYATGAFAPTEKPRAPFAESKDDRKDIVRGIAGRKNCDLVVVVTKRATGVGNTNQAIFGLGLLDMGRGILDNVILFTVFDIRVYDGRTFAVLGSKWALNSQMGIFSGMSAPYRQVDKTWWPASPAQVASDAKLKQATMELLEQAVTPMIADLFPEAQASAKR